MKQSLPNPTKTLTALGKKWMTLFLLTFLVAPHVQATSTDVEPTTSCNEECVEAFTDFTSYAFIINQLDGKYSFNSDKGTFEEFPDGTARLQGIIESHDNASKKWSVDIWLKDKRNWTQWSTYAAYPTQPTTWKGQLKNVNGTNVEIADDIYRTWSYYLIDSGADGQKSSFRGLGNAGGYHINDVLYIKHKLSSPYAVQLGKGANDRFNGKKGLSAWLEYEGVIGGQAISGGSGSGGTGTLADLNLDFCQDCTGKAIVNTHKPVASATIEPSLNAAAFPYADYITISADKKTITVEGLCPGDYWIHISYEDGTTGMADVTITEAEEGATVVTADYCPGTCIKAFEETNQSYAFYIAELNAGDNDGQYSFDTNNGSFEEFPDGTARLQGTIVNNENPNQKLVADIWLKDKRSWDEWDDLVDYPTVYPESTINFNKKTTFKATDFDIGDNFKNWSYYIVDEGMNGEKSTLKGLASGSQYTANDVLYLKHRFDAPYAVQVGQGANDKDDAVGISAWFRYDGVINGQPTSGGSGSSTSTLADFNVDFCVDCDGTATVTLPDGVSATNATLVPAKPLGNNIQVNGNTITITKLCKGNYKIIADDENCTTVHFTIGIKDDCPTDNGGENCDDKNILFVVKDAQCLHSGDQAIKARLLSMGHTVMVKSQNVVQTSDADGKDLVIISSSVDSWKIGSKFTNVVVPVITWESWLFDDLKMTGASENTDYGYLSGDGTNKVKIINAGHPLAAGLPAGKHIITTYYQNFRWGKPGNAAIKVGVVPGSSTKHMIFAYEAGTQMVGKTAPARRIGLFMEDNSAAKFKNKGWQLFDAAIKWAFDCNDDGGEIPGCELPAGFANSDIGHTGVAGDVCYDNGMYTVDASGCDIWGSQDGFHFVYKQFSGNGEIIARIADMGNNGYWNAGGIMMRETLEPGSKNVSVLATSNNNVIAQKRKYTGGNTYYNWGESTTLPVWVKLVRNGNYFTSYCSADGQTWNTLVTYNISMNTDIYIGLATTTQQSGVLNTYKFDNVSINNTSYKSNGDVENLVDGDDDMDLTIAAYPNPFTDNFLLNYEGFQGDKTIVVNIFNQAGQNVYTQTYNVDGTRKLSEKVRIPDLADGVYLLEAKSARNTKTVKLIKQQ